jgi:hypothetical protein
MKKIIIAVLFLSGCASKEKQLLERGQSFLKESMNDPSSFEPINAKITDTTTYVEYWTYWARMDSLSLESAKISGSEIAIRTRQENYNADLKKLKEAKPGEIRHITLLYEFRAKNGFGALAKGSQILEYSPSDDKFNLKQ